MKPGNSVEKLFGRFEDGPIWVTRTVMDRGRSYIVAATGRTLSALSSSVTAVTRYRFRLCSFTRSFRCVNSKTTNRIKMPSSERSKFSKLKYVLLYKKKTTTFRYKRYGASPPGSTINYRGTDDW